MSIAAVAWWASTAAAAEVGRSRWPSVLADLDDLCPESWNRATHLTADSGLEVRTTSAPADHDWPALVVDHDVAVLSLGLPLGLQAASPNELAQRVRDGADLASVVPPFGLVVRDRSGAVVIQQDWLGMCRLFVAEVDGLHVVGTRPSLVARMAFDRTRPDLEGWASYTLGGHFAGSLSPIAGISIMEPGERWSLTPLAGGGWTVDRTRRTGSSDVVLAHRELTPERAIDLAAESLRRVAEDLTSLAHGPVRIGLSGGKDSRLVVAAFLAAGARPELDTNIDTAAEGTTASELVARADEALGTHLTHRLSYAGSAQDVLDSGLHQRARDLRDRYDFQFPSSYLDRPSEGPRLSELRRPVSVTGAGGELATAYWYTDADPSAPATTDELVRRTTVRLTAATPLDALDPSWREGQAERLRGLVQGSLDIGLRGFEVLDHLYLVERVRRWYTSAYHVGMVTPFLAPELVAATFSLTIADKKSRLLHEQLIGRLMPCWSGVPYVSVSTGPSTATHVWDGDGLDVLCDLAESAGGSVSGLLVRERIEAELVAAATVPGRRTAHVLRQFTMLAVADERFEPESVRPVAGAVRAHVQAARDAPAAQPVPALAPPKRTLRRTLGRLRRRIRGR